jgi:hypothetical protein
MSNLTSVDPCLRNGYFSTALHLLTLLVEVEVEKVVGLAMEHVQLKENIHFWLRKGGFYD